MPHIFCNYASVFWINKLDNFETRFKLLIEDIKFLLLSRPETVEARQLVVSKQFSWIKIIPLESS